MKRLIIAVLLIFVVFSVGAQEYDFTHGIHGEIITPMRVALGAESDIGVFALYRGHENFLLMFVEAVGVESIMIPYATFGSIVKASETTYIEEIVYSKKVTIEVEDDVIGVFQEVDSKAGRQPVIMTVKPLYREGNLYFALQTSEGWKNILSLATMLKWRDYYLSR